ncbi:tetratricopeptide repeat protein, partial [Candidatus Nitrosopelagicus sp.]|nr:tetratricopeptide repeat protein [Candidatus Nitrosopelagicus sp.]
MIEVEEGNKLFLKKKFQESIKKYETVLEQEPNNLVALNNKGYSLSKLKKYSEALSCYDKFLQNSPNDKT